MWELGLEGEGEVVVSLATWKMALLMPQRQRAVREVALRCLLNWVGCFFSGMCVILLWMWLW